jgi:Tfp pilus assembly protein PilZ
MSEGKPRGPMTIASIVDIGAGGVCILTEDTIPLGSLLELSINFPSITTSVFALAKVVWIKESRASKRYQIGGQFVQINDSVQNLINGKVARVVEIVKKPHKEEK